MEFFVPGDAQHRQVERPVCGRCGITMWLARTQPSEQPDHDIRTFECPSCLTAVVSTVKYK